MPCGSGVMATDAMDLIRSTFLHAFFVQARGVVVRSPGSRRQVQFGAVRLIGAGTLPLDATDKAARLARRLSARAHPDQAVRLARSAPPLVRSMADAFMVTSVFRLATCCKELLEVSEDAAAAASLWGIGDLPLDLAAVQIWRGPALLAPAGVSSSPFAHLALAHAVDDALRGTMPGARSGALWDVTVRALAEQWVLLTPGQRLEAAALALGGAPCGSVEDYGALLPGATVSGYVVGKRPSAPVASRPRRLDRTHQAAQRNSSQHEQRRAAAKAAVRERERERMRQQQQQRQRQQQQRQQQQQRRRRRRRQQQQQQQQQRRRRRRQWDPDPQAPDCT